METLQVIERIEKDCQEKGHGRKKWWAETLGIHQQTLSYWLHAHRRPRGQRVQQINNHLSIMKEAKEAQTWSSILRRSYFDQQEIDAQILITAIKQILSSETIGSRDLAFISHILENSGVDRLYDNHSLLRNRLGWLLEASSKCPDFRPTKTKTMPFVDIGVSYTQPKALGYLKRVQTPLGRRWHVYDADISEIKRSFIGRLQANR